MAPADVSAGSLCEFAVRMAQAMLVQELFALTVDPLLGELLAALLVARGTRAHRLVFALAKFVVTVLTIRMAVRLGR